MWLFKISTGMLLHDGIYKAHGYAGNGEGKNNPAMQAAVNVGPLPVGRYEIIGPPYNTVSHGPFVLRLSPHIGTDTHGRGGFLIHGDSKTHPGSASRGCIILDYTTRREVWNSGDRELVVVSGDEESSATAA